ncbi:MAG: DNA polymerase Y family protein [Candidatus Dormibacteraeota bacterium]|nr:DNA polymerase Y family protein [Candidatus Dormibacteraeota bacterium]
MVGALVIPRFPLACELASRTGLEGRPVVVARDDGTVWASSPAAELFGVGPDQQLRGAIARCPELAVLEGRPAFYRVQEATILEALEATAFAVEPGPEGVWFMDIDGLVGCYGTQEAMALAILDSAPRALGPRLGIAPGKFPALVAARRATAGRFLDVQFQRVEDFLAGQPVEMLPVPEEMRRRLRLLGIETLGALAALPRSALTAQFGPRGALAWDLARGKDDSPVRPPERPEMVVEGIGFEVPLVSREALLVAAEQALGRALRDRRMTARAVRQAVLRAETERGACWERTVTFKEALAERDRLWTALRTVLSEAQLPGPVSRLELELTGLVTAQGRQLALAVGRRRLREQLEDALRQLKARYGYCPVGRVVEVEPWSRIPEQRLALIDYDT